MPTSPRAQAALFGAAALVLRLVGIDLRSLWVDEAFTAWLAAQPVGYIVGYPDFHPPLYYLFVKVWTALGPWAGTDAGLRLPSALASAAVVALSVWAVRRLNLPGGTLVGWLGLTSSLSVWYAQEARMYALASLALFAAALALLFAGAAIPRATYGAWIIYAIAATVGIYLHYDVVLALALLNSAFAVTTVRRRPSAARPWLVANIAVGACFAPHVPALLATLERSRSFHGLTSGPQRLAQLGAPALGAAALLIVFGIFGAVLVLVVRRPPLSTWTLAAGVVLLLAADAADLSVFGASAKRHVAVLLPLVILGVGVMSARLRLRYRAILPIAALPALLLTLFVHQKEDWRGAAEVLRAAAVPGDGVVYYRSWVSFGLERYYTWTGPAVGVDEASQLTQEPEGWSRVWLVEAETVDPPSLAPVFAARRPLLLVRQLPLVSVRLFGPAR